MGRVLGLGGGGGGGGGGGVGGFGGSNLGISILRNTYVFWEILMQRGAATKHVVIFENPSRMNGLSTSSTSRDFLVCFFIVPLEGGVCKTKAIKA